MGELTRSELACVGRDDIAAARQATAASSPVVCYLLSLAPGSRPAQAGAIRDVHRRLAWVGSPLSVGFGSSALSLEWHRLEPPTWLWIRSWLAETVSPATSNRKLCAVRGVLRACATLRLLTRDELAARLEALARIRGSRVRRGRAIDAGELAALFGALDESTPIGQRDAAILALLYSCGLRRAELCALDVADVSRDGLRVRGKGNQERLVPIPIDARSRLNVWIWEMRRPIPNPDPDDWRPGELAGPLFPRQGGGRMGTQGVYGRLRLLSDRAGILSVAPHDLRRSYASDLLDRGVDLSIVQSLMGHASPQTSAGYDRRPARARAAAVEALTLPPRTRRPSDASDP